MNKPRCQYCREKMEPKSSFGSRGTITPEEIKEFPWALTTYYECQHCHSRSPFCYTPEEAYAAAMKMSAVGYLGERARMEAWSAENCNQASLDCDDECCECPYNQVPDCKDEANRPLKAIAIVEQWAREHPEERSEE